MQTPAGWLLPSALFPAGTTQKAVLVQAVAALPMPAMPRCLAFPHIDGLAGSIDYTLIADLACGSRLNGAGGLEMLERERLVSGPGVVPYQATAIRRLVEGGEARSLALQPDWLQNVVTWAASHTGLAQQRNAWLTAAEVYRATERRTVVALSIDGQLVHFKSDVAEPFVEAEVTRLVAATCPGAVVPTRAFDAHRGWWLTDHVDGVPLTRNLWPAQLDAIEAWIDLQQALRGHHGALRAAGVVSLDRELLLSATERALQTVAALDPDGQRTAHARAQVHRLLDSDGYNNLPDGLLHFDAAGRNILRAGGNSVFLDLESAYLGPSAICAELMTRRMKHELSVAQQTELSHQALAHHVRVAGMRVTPPPELIRALADLCLLAYHHVRLTGPDHGAIDLQSPLYAWARVSVDFLARSNDWRL